MVKRLGLTALVLAAIAAFGLWQVLTPAAPGQSMLPPMAAVAEETAAPTTTEALPVIEDMVLGSPDAKVTLMEYGSYTCPHCRDFHAAVFRDLKRDYIDTGKVKFIFREVYFDRYGLWATMMARCGGPTRYFGIHTMLYDNQREWAGSDDPNAVIEAIRKIGKTAGMDDAMLDACLQDKNMAQALLNTYEANAKADNVEGTPTVFVNGVKHGNMDYAELKGLIDAELAK